MNSKCGCFAEEEQNLSKRLNTSVVKTSTSVLETPPKQEGKHYGSARWCMDPCAVKAATEKDSYTFRTEPYSERHLFNAPGDVTPLGRQQSTKKSMLQPAEFTNGDFLEQDEPSETNVCDDELSPSDQPPKLNDSNKGQSIGMS